MRSAIRFNETINRLTENDYATDLRVSQGFGPARIDHHKMWFIVACAWRESRELGRCQHVRPGTEMPGRGKEVPTSSPDDATNPGRIRVAWKPGGGTRLEILATAR